MAINQPPIKSSPAILCDWIEISAISDPKGKFRLYSLMRFVDTHKETEESDYEGRHRREEDTSEEGVSGNDEDAFLDSIIHELSERANFLSNCYPFELDEVTSNVSLKNNLTEGEFIYLFCLLLSNSKRGEIFDGSWLPSIDNFTRDLFQACATLAAAGEVEGCAISFGWPRPNNNPAFLAKLQEVYNLFGEGQVVTEPRPGVSPSPKDEEIDIIAWTPRLDKAAGTYYLLGQVASGDNWQFKSIKGGAIDSLHHSWFSQPPASQAMASIFIPHLIQVVERGEGSRADRINALTARFGIIFDRLRLPLFAMKGIYIADGERTLDAPFKIERRDEIPRIEEWITTEVTKLKEAKEAQV